MDGVISVCVGGGSRMDDGWEWVGRMDGSGVGAGGFM